jgi:O-antigen/teichoic acid export membrane protein
MALIKNGCLGVNRLADLYHRSLADERVRPLVRSLSVGLIWSVIGAVVSRIFVLIASVAVFRQVGIEAFGQFGAIQATMVVMGSLAGLGLSLTTTKHVSQHLADAPSKAGRIPALATPGPAWGRGIASIGVWVAAPLISRAVLADVSLVTPVRIASPLILLGALNGVQTGALIALQRFKTIAGVNVFVGVMTPLILGSASYLGGLNGCCAGLLLMGIITCAANHLSVQRAAFSVRLPIHFRGAWSERSVLYRFAIPALASGLLAEPVTWFCTVLIINQPGGYAEIAKYYAAAQWATAILFVPALLGQVAFPSLSASYARGDYRSSLSLLKYTTLLSGIISVSLVVLLSAFASQILGLYDPVLAHDTSTFIIVMVTAALMSVMSPVGLMLAVSGQMWLGFCMNLGWAITFAGCTFFLKSEGAVGLAVARCIAYAVHGLWVTAYTVRLVNAHPSELLMPTGESSRAG